MPVFMLGAREAEGRPVAVRYMQVKPEVDFFSSVIRPTGNIVFLGHAVSGRDNIPVALATAPDAERIFGDPARSDLTRAIQLAFRQTPGPSRIWGVRTGADPAAGLAAAENLDVQFVVLANTVLDERTGAGDGPVSKLVKHVEEMSNTRGDGRERMAVVMLPQDSADTALVMGNLANERVVYIAHRSDQDAAAAVAGTIAGYPPHVSLLLKQVKITSPPFTPAEIDGLDPGVDWLTTPMPFPGEGVYLSVRRGKHIHVIRTVDDISFKLKARLIRSTGALRISRDGLRSLETQMAAVLEPLCFDGVIDGYDVAVPILQLLDADPAVLTPVQHQMVKNAKDTRTVRVTAAVRLAGAVHRIEIPLKLAQEIPRWGS